MFTLDDFPFHDIFDFIETNFDNKKQQMAISFILSEYSAPLFREAALKYAVQPSFVTGLVDVLNTDYPRTAILAITEMTLSNCLEPILPPKQDTFGDFLSLLPTNWLHTVEGSMGMEAYEEDAQSRALLFPRERPSGSGSGAAVFEALLAVFRRFRELPMGAQLGVTRALALLLTAAPDLAGAVGAVFAEVVGDFGDVAHPAVPSEGGGDSAEVRAGILAEFGKELQQTVTARRKTDAVLEEITKQ